MQILKVWKVFKTFQTFRKFSKKGLLAPRTHTNPQLKFLKKIENFNFFFKNFVCGCWVRCGCQKPFFWKFSETLENFKNFSYLDRFQTIKTRRATSAWNQVFEAKILDFRHFHHIYAIYMPFWRKMGPNFGKEYFHKYKELENDIPTDWKPMGSTFKIYGAHPSMCTHRHTIRKFLKIGEISGVGPLKSEGIVPPGCAYWGAHHGGFIAPDLSYNIFRSQLLTPIS